jgi:hypothetical protein
VTAMNFRLAPTAFDAFDREAAVKLVLETPNGRAVFHLVRAGWDGEDTDPGDVVISANFEVGGDAVQRAIGPLD